MSAGLLYAFAPLSLAESLLTTPRQPAGPFYPVTLPLDDDNDLTEVAGSQRRAEGQICDLQGRLLDSSGSPLPDARIEIWQCDARGHYLHPNDRSGEGRDVNFQGHGHTRTDSAGRYRFRTIRPVPYPGRTPHIHVAVFFEARPSLVTQIYIKDEPRNSHDFLYNRVPFERRHLVLADFRAVVSHGSEFAAEFDLILGFTPPQA